MEVIEAFNNGKTVQFQNPLTGEWQTWESDFAPTTLDIEQFEWRIVNHVEFEYHDGYVFYDNVSGLRQQINIESWKDKDISIEKIMSEIANVVIYQNTIKNDIKVRGGYIPKNQMDFIYFCYAVAKGWIKELRG